MMLSWLHNSAKQLPLERRHKPPIEGVTTPEITATEGQREEENFLSVVASHGKELWTPMKDQITRKGMEKSASSTVVLSLEELPATSMELRNVRVEVRSQKINTSTRRRRENSTIENREIGIKEEIGLCPEYLQSSGPSTHKYVFYNFKRPIVLRRSNWAFDIPWRKQPTPRNVGERLAFSELGVRLLERVSARGRVKLSRCVNGVQAGPIPINGHDWEHMTHRRMTNHWLVHIKAAILFVYGNSLPKPRICKYLKLCVWRNGLMVLDGPTFAFSLFLLAHKFTTSRDKDLLKFRVPLSAIGSNSICQVCHAITKYLFGVWTLTKLLGNRWFFKLVQSQEFQISDSKDSEMLGVDKNSHAIRGDKNPKLLSPENSGPLS